MTIEKSILLVNSEWNQQKSFRGIPVTLDCPYQELIYDPASKVMVIISKVTKQNYTMVPKIDDNGDLAKCKQVRSGGKNYKEERRMVDTYQEYYIETEAEIRVFITLFAINADTFDLEVYLNPPVVEKPKEAPGLTNMKIVESTADPVV